MKCKRCDKELGDQNLRLLEIVDATLCDYCMESFWEEYESFREKFLSGDIGRMPFEDAK